MRRKRPTRTSVMVRVLMAALAVALAAVLVVQLTSVTSGSASSSSPSSSLSTSPSFTEEEKPRTHQVMNHEKEKEKEEAAKVSTSDATGEDGKVKDAADEIPALYTYKVVKEYAHDYDAFTQGFLYQEDCQDFFNSIDKSKCKDMFLESTGLYGKTQVKKVDLLSGETLKSTKAEQRHFGEGLTRWGDQLIQLTWKGPTVLIYNASDLKLMRESKTDLKDGWGLTNDTEHLIATDSGHNLYFLDPDTLTTTRKVPVMDGDQRVNRLNELEHIEGEVWANIWMTNCIARIDPIGGKVKGWILADGLVKREMEKNTKLGRLNDMDVLNGIAYDPATKRIWLTGKQWSTIYEVQIEPTVPHERGYDLSDVRNYCIV